MSCRRCKKTLYFLARASGVYGTRDTEENGAPANNGAPAPKPLLTSQPMKLRLELGSASNQIQPGQRIEAATLGAIRTADGLCYLPHTRLSGQLVGEKNAGRMQVLIGADCSITVEAVEFTTKKPTVTLSTVTERFGWAKSELNDFAG